jgi:hypothetical protein
MESTTFLILSAISILSIMLLMKTLVGIFPSLLASTVRWKESVNIEASAKLSRDRNLIATALAVPFCLIISNNNVYFPEYYNDIQSEGGRIWVTLSIFAGYLCLRRLLELIFLPKKANVQTYNYANRSAFTFFIILTLLLLALCGSMSVFSMDYNSVKDAILWLSGAVYILFLIRKSQIFISSYSIFAGFLYLCALEILPTGILIVSAVIL